MHGSPTVGHTTRAGSNRAPRNSCSHTSTRMRTRTRARTQTSAKGFFQGNTNTNTNTKYTCDTGQARNKLLEQWMHLTNHTAGHSRIFRWGFWQEVLSVSEIPHGTFLVVHVTSATIIYKFMNGSLKGGQARDEISPLNQKWTEISPLNQFLHSAARCPLPIIAHLGRIFAAVRPHDTRETRRFLSKHFRPSQGRRHSSMRSAMACACLRGAGADCSR